MAKLYPPYIEGKIPAQYGNQLVIPFEDNRAVGQYDAIQVVIKTLASNKQLGEYKSNTITNGKVYFNLGENNSLVIGQSYKIQLCYVNEEGLGYLSTVGVFKYTGTAAVEISGLVPGVNANQYTYDGVYTNTDATEIEYSYKYELYQDEELIYSSGELIHNSSNETDKFTLPVNLELDIRYSLVYTVTTINNLMVSKSYYIADRTLSEIEMPINIALIADMNQDEGCVSVSFASASNESVQLAGQFRLMRFYDNNVDIIGTFTINTVVSAEPIQLYYDFTVQQGVAYKYAIQQFSDKISTKKVYSNEIYSDFEDMFLFDGTRQLKIKYNPKVTSFKNTILESKIDTLGGKYPFFFRNGNANYKEFPISGLISILSDENQFFFNEFFDNEDCAQTDLTGYNYNLERKFKLEVLNWLNDGKPKLFRSAAEGNYIVRLMNISLSPIEQLGRMLHTFNSQAYEIMDCNFQNLQSYNLIPGLSDISQMIITSGELSQGETLGNITTLYLSIMAPIDSVAAITFANGESIEIQIGNTQVYEVPVQRDNPVVGVTATNIVSTSKESKMTIYYDSASKLEYPITHNGKKIIGVEYNERATQYKNARIINVNENQNQLLYNYNTAVSNYYDSFNIISLTLSAIVDPANPPAETDATYNAIIGFDNKVETINLGRQNLGNMDGFGHITYTCEAFEDNRFQPTYLEVGQNVRANVYYSLVKYHYEEAAK